MSELTIKTNHHSRDLIAWCDLTAKEAEEFDYITDDQEKFSPRLFRYRGEVYDTNEFMRCALPTAYEAADEFNKWDGYQSDTFFSGILIKYTDDYERVMVATYFS